MSIICATCLSKDRTLTVITDEYHKILMLLSDSIKELKGAICWECKAILRKIHRFSKQVDTAQNVLQSVRKKQNFTSLSTLAQSEIEHSNIVNFSTTNSNQINAEISDLDVMKIKNDSDTESCGNISNKNIKEATESFKEELLTVESIKDQIVVKSENHLVLTKNELSEDDQIAVKTVDELINVQIEVKSDAMLRKNEYLYKDDQSVDSKDNLLLIKSEKLSNDEVVIKKEDIPILPDNEELYNDQVVVELYDPINNDHIVGETKDDSVLNNELNNDQTLSEFTDLNQAEIQADEVAGTASDIYERFIKIVFTEEEMLEDRRLRSEAVNYKRNPFKCEDCIVGFLKKENYDKHILVKHSVSQGHHICHICRTTHHTQWHLNNHVSSHYNQYKCKLCAFKSHHLSYMQIHYDMSHKESNEKMYCKECGEVCGSPQDITAHMKIGHTLSPMCTWCGETFATLGTLRKHEKNVHISPRAYICDFCKKGFTSRSRFELHLVRHDNTLVSKYAYCVECRVQYKNIHVYRRHLRVSPNHTHERYECDVCKKSFKSKVYLTRHHSHGRPKQCEYKCNTCSESFKNRTSLRNHRNAKHDSVPIKEYSCDVCGKIFKSLQVLKNHRLIHSTERKFVCSDCGHTFKQSAALYNHNRIVHKGYKRNQTKTS